MRRWPLGSRDHFARERINRSTNLKADMKTMKTPRGTARAQRRSNRVEGKMQPPSALAQAAQLADQKRANGKLAIKLHHKSGDGIGGA